MEQYKCYFEEMLEKMSAFVSEEQMKSYREKADRYINGALAGSDKVEHNTFIDKLMGIIDANNEEEISTIASIFDKLEYTISKDQVRALNNINENVLFEVLYRSNDAGAAFFVKDKEQMDRFFKFKEDKHGYNDPFRYYHLDRIIEYFICDYLSFYRKGADKADQIIDYLESILTPYMKTRKSVLYDSKLKDAYRRLVYSFLDDNEDLSLDGFTQFKSLNKDQLNILIERMKQFKFRGLTCKDISRFRSLNFLYLTFFLDSDSHYFKEKTLESRIYALWYICRKGKDIKYLKSHLGKWASLPKLYNYNFDKIMDILKSTEEMKASFDNLDIDF